MMIIVEINTEWARVLAENIERQEDENERQGNFHESEL